MSTNRPETHGAAWRGSGRRERGPQLRNDVQTKPDEDAQCEPAMQVVEQTGAAGIDAIGPSGSLTGM